MASYHKDKMPFFVFLSIREEKILEVVVQTESEVVTAYVEAKAVFTESILSRPLFAVLPAEEANVSYEAQFLREVHSHTRLNTYLPRVR